MVKVIEGKTGYKKGEYGVTVMFLKQKKGNGVRKSFTVHGLSVDQAYQKAKFFFRALEKMKSGEMEIWIET